MNARKLRRMAVKPRQFESIKIWYEYIMIKIDINQDLKKAAKEGKYTTQYTSTPDIIKKHLYRLTNYYSKREIIIKPIYFMDLVTLDMYWKEEKIEVDYANDQL